MWTLFWDMNSGGDRKEKWCHIYIEAPEAEARIIFYNRFGHSPDRVSCICCGEDYFVSSHESLAQLSGFHRNCRVLATPRAPNYYLEAGEKPPRGFKVDERFSRFGEYVSLATYRRQKDVLVIPKSKIKAAERKGVVPEQGYVWVG